MWGFLKWLALVFVLAYAQLFTLVWVNAYTFGYEATLYIDRWGEAGAIALAEDVGGRCLSDDNAARRTASSLGVEVGGTLYMLLSGLERGAYPFEGT